MTTTKTPGYNVRSMDATTTIAAKAEGSRVATVGTDTESRVHILVTYGDDKAICGTVVGVTWYRMSEWVPVPGGSPLCRRCLIAERKIVEAQAHMARVREEDRQRTTTTNEELAMNTPRRSVRVPDDLWHAAQQEAARRGETVTDAITRALTRYTKAGSK